MARELGGDMAGGGRMDRKVAQHRFGLFRPGLVVNFAEDRQRTGLVEPVDEDGLARPRIGGHQPLSRAAPEPGDGQRSEGHTSALQSLMRISYAVFCLKNKQQPSTNVSNSPADNKTP